MKWIIVVMGLLHPNLTQADPSLPPFVPNHQNGCIGHFDNIQQQYNQALAISTLDSIQIDTFQKQCGFYLDSLQCLDSILYVNYDTIVKNLRVALATDFGNIIQQQQMFFDNISSAQQIALATAEGNNNNFNTTVLHEQFEKQMNEIYLQTIALGILNFTPSQIATIQNIASYCPNDGGAPVHQARGILSMFQDINLLDYDCVTNQQAKKSQSDAEAEIIKEWNINLYPNPTDNQITIQSNFALSSNSSIEIYNALGQLVQAKFVTTETNYVIIDVSSFINGIYVVHLKNDNNTITKSFVVSK